LTLGSVPIDTALFLVGFVALVKGADLLVSGAASIADRLGIPPLIVGLTIVSFGTSMPELLVTMVAGVQGNAGLAVGNVLGSNIANVLLVLGIAAIIRPLPVHDSTVVSEIPFSLTAALLVGFLANAALFSDHVVLSITALDGAILLLFFALFMVYVYRVSRGRSDEPATATHHGVGRSLIYILVGATALYLGGGWVVRGAVGIATMFGVSDALIGLTIVAIGTSTPELIASGVAAWRNQPDIAVGNVVGSNIFNLLWILGLTASFVDLPFEIISNTDLAIVIGSSSLILIALILGRSNTIMRSHGVVFVTLYAIYLIYVVARQGTA
jgi:cation:H+ antiporter